MNTATRSRHQPWNKGKLVGEKAPLEVRNFRGSCWHLLQEEIQIIVRNLD
jgi:hypothetical protein